jgi:hypothetical protein
MRVRIEDEKVAVYVEMDLNSSPVAELLAKTEIELTKIIERTGLDWAEIVLPEGKLGYILGDTQIFEIREVILNQNETLVYEQPSKRPSLKACLNSGSEVCITDELTREGLDWFKIKVAGGTSGFVHGTTRFKEKGEALAFELEREPPKNIPRKMFAMFVVFNVVIVTTLWSFASFSNWVQLASATVALFFLLWPILSAFTGLYYRRAYGRSVLLLLFGPYLLAVGILAGITTVGEGRGYPTETVSYIWVHGSAPPTTETHYSNDKGWVVLIMALLGIVGGAGMWAEGVKRLGQTDPR